VALPQCALIEVAGNAVAEPPAQLCAARKTGSIFQYIGKVLPSIYCTRSVILCTEERGHTEKRRAEETLFGITLVPEGRRTENGLAGSRYYHPVQLHFRVNHRDKDHAPWLRSRARSGENVRGHLLCESVGEFVFRAQNFVASHSERARFLNSPTLSLCGHAIWHGAGTPAREHRLIAQFQKNRTFFQLFQALFTRTFHKNTVA